jgi:hypothetical protein
MRPVAEEKSASPLQLPPPRLLNTLRGKSL